MKVLGIDVDDLQNKSLTDLLIEDIKHNSVYISKNVTEIDAYTGVVTTPFKTKKQALLELTHGMKGLRTEKSKIEDVLTTGLMDRLDYWDALSKIQALKSNIGQGTIKSSINTGILPTAKTFWKPIFSLFENKENHHKDGLKKLLILINIFKLTDPSYIIAFKQILGIDNHEFGKINDTLSLKDAANNVWIKGGKRY